MKIHKIIIVCFMGVITVYIFQESLDLIHPKQYHAEFGDYSNTQSTQFTQTTISGTATVNRGTFNYY